MRRYSNNRSNTIKSAIIGLVVLVFLLSFTFLNVQVFAPEGKKVTDWFAKTEQTLPESNEETETPQEAPVRLQLK